MNPVKIERCINTEGKVCLCQSHRIPDYYPLVVQEFPVPSWVHLIKDMLKVCIGVQAGLQFNYIVKN